MRILGKNLFPSSSYCRSPKPFRCSFALAMTRASVYGNSVVFKMQLLDIPCFWATVTAHGLHGTKIEDEPRVLMTN